MYDCGCVKMCVDRKFIMKIRKSTLKAGVFIKPKTLDLLVKACYIVLSSF